MMENEFKILIVDNDLVYADFLLSVLTIEGFQVMQTNSGEAAVELAKKHTPHLIFLEIILPKMTGFETCMAIRNIPEICQTKIVFLSALSDDNSKIQGFDAGGDDFVCKPVKPKVLAARLGALLKDFKVVSSSNSASDLFTKIGDVTIDFEKYVVYVGEKEVVLPKKEFLLLKLLASKPLKVFSRQEIFDHIWGDGYNQDSRYIDVHIYNLREKLGPNHIKTIKGVGYKFSNTKTSDT
jgi:two-component system alkaline phosphatase synthesis response regulator PhoP